MLIRKIAPLLILLGGCASSYVATVPSANHPANPEAKQAPSEPIGAVIGPGLPELTRAVMNNSEDRNSMSMNMKGMDMSGMDHDVQAGNEMKMENRMMKKPDPNKSTNSVSSVLPEDVSRYLTGLLEAYVTVGNHLASDETEGIADPAKNIAQLIDSLANTELPENPHFWHMYSEQVTTIKEQAEVLSATSSLDQARLAYSKVSDALEVILSKTGVPEKFDDIYSYVCSMYKKGPRGIWIQAGEQPRNPYQGSSMLRCSSQKTLIPPAGNQSHEGGHQHE